MASPNPVAYQNKMRASLARAKNSARSDASAGGRKPDEAPSKKSAAGAKGMGADLKRAQNLIANRLDKNKSAALRLSGTTASALGKTAGGALGSFVPVVGTALGAALGSRVGRLAGENPVEAILLAALGLFVSILPSLIVIGMIIVIIKSIIG